MKMPPEELQITDNIFDELADERPSNRDANLDSFRKIVRKHYFHVSDNVGLEPIINDSRLDDAWQAFCFDKKHYLNSLPGSSQSPDHFKLCGTLVYWLRRFAPVYGFRDLNSPAVKEHSKKLIEQYGSEFLAFDLGLNICIHFEKNIPDLPSDYVKAISYFMKFKNVSPHSMGMIFRSLFVPLMPK